MPVSPCGPNSQCRNIEDHAVCSCLQGYLGSPPSCRPECVVSSECPPTRACVNKKCTDPCLGSCGLNARCEVINHSPICSCLPGQTGDPFKSCYDILSKKLSINYCKFKCHKKWSRFLNFFFVTIIIKIRSILKILFKNKIEKC